MSEEPIEACVKLVLLVDQPVRKRGETLVFAAPLGNRPVRRRDTSRAKTSTMSVIISANEMSTV